VNDAVKRTHRFGLLTPSSNTTQEPEFTAALPPSVTLARKADRPDADAIIMPGGNWASMPVVERLESELGKPVLVNNAVSLWAGLRLLKRDDSIAGYGTLLRDHVRHQ
jgi:arylmalonate decarboxylase